MKVFNRVFFVVAIYFSDGVVMETPKDCNGTFTTEEGEDVGRKESYNNALVEMAKYARGGAVYTGPERPDNVVSRYYPPTEIRHIDIVELDEPLDVKGFEGGKDFDVEEPEQEKASVVIPEPPKKQQKAAMGFTHNGR